MSSDTDAIREALAEFLRDESDLPRDSYTSATALFSSGLLDSFSLVALLSFAERRFGVNIPPEALTQETIDTLDSFASYIASKQLR